MIVEKESDRPALKLNNRHALHDQQWIIYDPDSRAYAAYDEWYDTPEQAERFGTIEEAKEVIVGRGFGHNAIPAFIETTTVIHY